MTQLATLYDTDYTQWAQRNAELLLVLLAHLLKWQFQYRTLTERWREFDGRSWRATINEQREQLAELFHQSPGLTAAIEESIAAA